VSPSIPSIVKKAIMAVTGLFGLGFVFFHMYGNLKIFEGQEYFNEYAHSLRAIGAPIFGHLHLLTVLRLVLIASVILHVWAAVSLYRQARRARPTKYAVKRTVQADYAAVTMRWGGLVIVLFLLFHLADLTWGVSAVSPGFDRSDPYANVVSTFQSLPVVFFYLLALAALGMHLYHGTWSMFQTLGFLNQRYDPAVRILSWVLALVIPIGFAIVPVAVVAGFVG
jgi:succinate dehydrogenase / fumarate reductase cytochrome b subunit